MLVIMRRIGEGIMIRDDINLVVLGTKGDETKIGINAPDNIKILREEIYKKSAKKDNNKNN